MCVCVCVCVRGCGWVCLSVCVCLCVCTRHFWEVGLCMEALAGRPRGQPTRASLSSVSGGGPGHGFSLRIFSSLFCFYGWSEVGVFKADSTSVELTKDPSGPFSFPKEGPHKQPVIRQEFVMLSKTERTKIFFCKTNLIVWKNKE